jgi:hypothetical protein
VAGNFDCNKFVSMYSNVKEMYVKICYIP